MRYVVCIIAFLVAAADPAWAERRVALVMGADNYETMRLLDNATSDALAMKDALEALDFEVFLETDRDLRRMRRALEDFVYDAEGADVALVFFAGHGVEIAGENRLLPVDASADTLAALKASSLPLEEVRETVAKVARIGLIVLDACRDDPFAGAAEDGGRGANALSKLALPASVRPGLGRMGRSENVLYAFAAAPGETAADGAGENSPFTTALTEYLGTAGLEIRSVLTLVQQEVYDRTRGAQLPYVESGLPETFFAATATDELPERERLLLAMADVTPQIRDEIERVATEHDTPLAPLYGALIGSRLQGLSGEDRDRKLEEAARAYADTREKLRTLASSDPEVARLRAEAEESLALGAFREAAAHLDRAIATDREARTAVREVLVGRTVSQAASLVARAGVERTALDHAAAIASLEEAAALHSEIEAFDVPDAARKDRNWLLAELGDLHMLTGDTAGALDAYLWMQRAAEVRLERTSGEPVAKRDLSVSHNRIGDALLARGDISGAEKAYRAGNAIVTRLAIRDPENWRWHRDLVVSHSKIGDLRVKQGDLAAALLAYQTGLEAFQVGFEIVARLDLHETSTMEWQRDLSAYHVKIGDVRMLQGDLAGALATYRRGHRITARLAAHDPNNTEWQHDLVVSQGKIGSVLAANGDLDGAFEAYRANLRIAARLATRDPDNAEWQDELAVWATSIGEVLVEQDDLAGALEAYRAALHVRTRLVKRDPGNAKWHWQLLLCHGKIGDVLVAQGDPAGGLGAYRTGLDIAVQLSRLDPDNANWQRELSVLHSRVGAMLEAQGDLAGALEAYETGHEIAVLLAARDPNNAEWQRDLIVSHFKIAEAGGDPRTHFAKALEIALELEASGRLVFGDTHIPDLLRGKLDALEAAED